MCIEYFTLYSIKIARFQRKLEKLEPCCNAISRTGAYIMHCCGWCTISSSCCFCGSVSHKCTELGVCLTLQEGSLVLDYPVISVAMNGQNPEQCVVTLKSGPPVIVDLIEGTKTPLPPGVNGKWTCWRHLFLC